MMCDYIYIVNWEIIRSGRVREFTTLDKEEFDVFVSNIIKSSKYKLLEAYKLDLEEL